MKRPHHCGCETTWCETTGTPGRDEGSDPIWGPRPSWWTLWRAFNWKWRRWSFGPVGHSTLGGPTSLVRSKPMVFTSTKVPKFAGVTSWEQYRQVFDAIVQSNGWDDATVALQLLYHQEGDALNVALLVPEARRATRTGLVGALMEHHGSPGQLADYRREFEKTTRKEGEDPSIFAIALETPAVKAFGDMGHTARFRIIRDRFVAGHDSCALRRHLDSVPPETRDVVDRCRVWESHVDTEARRFSKPGPERDLPIYTVETGTAGNFAKMVASNLVGACVAPPPPPNRYPQSWKVYYSDYWRECQHPSPLRHSRLGLPTWRLCCSGCFRVYRLWILRRDRAPFVGTGLQWCVSHVESLGMEWGGGRQLCDDLTSGSRGTSPGVKNGDWSREGGQPTGSVMDFDPNRPVVVSCGSLPLGRRQWHGRCFDWPVVDRHDGQWDCTLDQCRCLRCRSMQPVVDVNDVRRLDRLAQVKSGLPLRAATGVFLWSEGRLLHSWVVLLGACCT